MFCNLLSPDKVHIVKTFADKERGFYHRRRSVRYDHDMEKIHGRALC